MIIVLYKCTYLLTFQDNWNDLEATTASCFQLTVLSLTLTDIRHRHHHHGGMSKKTPPLTELQIPATVTARHIFS